MADKNFLEDGMDIVVLTDEEGNETEFEVIDVKEYNGNTYYALIPLEDDAETDDEAIDFVILKSEIGPDGEEMLVTVDDDDEFYDVADLFEDIRFDELDYDDDEEDDK